MTALLEAIRVEIEARQARMKTICDELDRLAAMKTTAEGLADAPALDADAADGDPRVAPATPPPAEKPKASTDAAARPAPSPRATSGNGRGAGGELTEKQQALVDAVNTLVEASTGEIAAHTGRTGEEVAVCSALKDLRDRGLVAHNGQKGRGARWLAVNADQAAAERAAASPMKSGGGAARLLRQIMDTLGSDPGLTEQQLAQALDVDRDDVAEACGKALERGWVTLAPDGTYYAVTDDDTTDEQGGTPRDRRGLQLPRLRSRAARRRRGVRVLQARCAR